MIGILGGTFDPIHLGHLRLAEEVREALDLEQVRFVPAHQPPHRRAPVASAAHRLAMVRRATEDNPHFAVDDREYRRGGASWMVDTCASLREEYGERPLALIMGMDAFNGFTRWREWARILDLVHLAIATRPGSRAEDEAAELLAARRRPLADLPRSPGGRIVEVRITALDISATHIRELAAAGRSTRYLLPKPVQDYLAEYGLY
ncbi:MAG: nicotinate-nucleotide adenylyltransferase [Pseudomonadota bacterium]